MGFVCREEWRGFSDNNAICFLIFACTGLGRRAKLFRKRRVNLIFGIFASVELIQGGDCRFNVIKLNHCPRFQVSLALCEGSADERAAMSASDRIRVTALAAANLAERDTPRASVLFGAALAEAERAGLDAADPTNRALAVTANNLACTLEEKTRRSPAERALMTTAARAARRFWALAGTWLETERAEYRLAMTWLQAAQDAQAAHEEQGHERHEYKETPTIHMAPPAFLRGLFVLSARHP